MNGWGHLEYPLISAKNNFDKRFSYETCASENSILSLSPERYNEKENKRLRLMSIKFDQDTLTTDNDFKKKIKTEMCKNWQLNGSCPFF